MNPTEQERADVRDIPGSEQIQIEELLAAVWRRRIWLARIVASVSLVVAVIAFLISNEYTSTIQLMPPDPQLLSGPSLLSGLSGGGGGLLASGAAGALMGQKSPGATYIGILSSRTELDSVINRFDLRKVYHTALYQDARSILQKRTSFTEDKKSGLITITVTDSDRYRARDIAQAYIEELDLLVNGLSTSSARRERIFLEQRLRSTKETLDASSRALSQFSSRNAMLDLQKQGEVTIEATGKLQGQLITAQGELSGLKAQYADDNVRVRKVRAQIDELQGQLREMSNVQDKSDGGGLAPNQLLPSVRQLPLLGLTYYELYRQVSMEETLYESLNKEYELAQVQEAKEIPPIRILDLPDVPERKSSPHRGAIISLGILLSFLAGCGSIVVCEMWKNIDSSHPAKTLAVHVLRSVLSPAQRISH